MSAERLEDYLEHIEQSAREALDFIVGHTRESFSLDRRTQQAVVMSLIVIGEASTRIMTMFPEFAAANPQVPWQAMRGMRNRKAHGYFDINLDVVWTTLQDAIPKLIEQIADTRKSNRGSDI